MERKISVLERIALLTTLAVGCAKAVDPNSTKIHNSTAGPVVICIREIADTGEDSEQSLFPDGCNDNQLKQIAPNNSLFVPPGSFMIDICDPRGRQCGQNPNFCQENLVDPVNNKPYIDIQICR